MKFGIDHLFTWRGGTSQAEVLREAIEQTVLAEELGFDSCWLAEHHFSNYGIVGGLLTMAAALAQATSRIRIGLAVSVLPLNNPIRLAEDIALVDNLSNGRLDVGVGRGYQPAEFEKFGIPFDEARERFDESLEILQRSWTGRPFSFEGKFWQFRDVTVFPTPIQRPHPPVLHAAVSTSTFERVGAQGLGILTSPNFTSMEVVKACFDAYRGALIAGGHNPAAYDYPLLQQVYVNTDQSRAESEPKDHAMWYYDRLGNLLPSADANLPEQYKQYGKISRNVGKLTYEYLLEHGVNFGTPELVAEKIGRLQNEVGVNHYIGWFNVGGLPHDRVMRSMRLFASEVMPRFSAETVTVSVNR